jgi:hypothetical protein
VKRRILPALLLGLTAWLAAAGPTPAEAPITPVTAEAPAEAGQILVMFRLPPAHYRGRSDYSGSYGDQIGRSARRRMAAKIAREEGLTLVDAWAMPLVGVDCFIMSLPPGRSPQEVAERVSRRKGVAWAEPMVQYHAQSAPAVHNDPLFAAQPAAKTWRLAALHEISTGRNVRVAVIDSLVDAGHPDLAGQVALSENFVSGRGDVAERHGTAVAGVIAARGDNGQGVVGVAPNARLLALRACWQTGAETTCDTLSLARALVVAVDRNAQVINLSMSGPSTPLLGRLLDVAMARGAVVVGAFDPALPGGGFPASHTGVVAVSDGPAAPRPGVFVAPGRDIPTTQPGGRWFVVDGASYSAAHVSGLFALMREKRGPAANAAALVSTPREAGVIDACATLVRAVGPCDCSCSRIAVIPATKRP